MLIPPIKLPEQGIIEEKENPKIEYPENPDRYNYTNTIPILYLSPKPIEALKLLKDNTSDFFDAGEEFGIDPYLIMAIGIHESAGGQKIPPGSFNPFGRVCGKGYECVVARDATTGESVYWIKFESWKEAIFDEAKYLRTKYYDRGFNTIEKIGKIYAEDIYWPQKIRRIIKTIEN